MPANYLHVTTGVKLDELDQATDDAEGGGSPVNVRALAFLFAIAFVALLPTLFKSKFEKWSGATTGAEEETTAAAAAVPVATEDGAAATASTAQQQQPQTSQRQTRSSTKKKNASGGTSNKLDKQI
jgi:hypothetical protein